jgi:phosphoketolase
MLVRNRVSHYHLVIQAAQKIAKQRSGVGSVADDLVRLYERKIREHTTYALEHGVDPFEIAAKVWQRPAAS